MRGFVEEYWTPIATAAWENTAKVIQAFSSQDWPTILAAIKTYGATGFCGLQRALDFLDAPGYPQLGSNVISRLDDIGTWVVGPGTARGLRWLCGPVPEKRLLQKLKETQMLVERQRKRSSNARFLPSGSLRATAPWLCELDKYCRAATRSGAARLRVKGSSERLGGSGGDTRDHPRDEVLL